MGFIYNLKLKWQIAALENEDCVKRANAAVILGDMGDAKAVEPLIAALKDRSSYVRGLIVESLGKLGDPRAINYLITALQDKDLGVRQRVIDALGKIGDARTVEPLIMALEDQDENVRKAAATALGKIDDPRAKEALPKDFKKAGETFANKSEIRQKSIDGRNLHYEQQLKNNFGLTFLGNGWAYEGVRHDGRQEWNNPNLCLPVLQKVQSQIRFDQVCIVAGGLPVLIICNSKPPLCVVTSFGSTDIANVIVSIIEASGQSVNEYKGTWLLKFSNSD